MSWAWEVEDFTSAPTSQGAKGTSARATPGQTCVHERRVQTERRAGMQAHGWRFGLLLLSGLTCLGQVSTPLIGYLRDLRGALRPLHGVAGAFVSGVPVERDVLSAAWSGSAGFAKKASELLVLGPRGLEQRIAAPAGPAQFGFLPDGTHGWVRFADGSCRKFGSDCPTASGHEPMPRVRLPERVLDFELLGDGWLVARTADKLYAIRTGRHADELYELPEDER